MGKNEILSTMLEDDGLLSIRHINKYTNFVSAALFENNLDKVEINVADQFPYYHMARFGLFYIKL